ncbi:MAG: hypothetical protein C0593_11955 [Marinilabiliales bacterium]|nr:MAG: hypothetical protein C0593_11955 [Marinilabiliales bacterium]
MKIKTMQRNVLFIFVLLFVASTSLAQSFSQWRGVDGDGIYKNETGLLKSWPEEGPEVLWVYEGLGMGHSSPAIANDKIFTTGMTDSTGYLFALNMDGSLNYKIAYGREWTISFEGSRSTPTIVDNLIYVYSSFGEVVCYDDNTQQEKWRVNVLEDYDGVNIKWGVTESLIVDGDKLFVSPGGQKNNVIALNRFTGELIWTTGARGDISAYCTPMIIQLPERKILVTMMSNHVIGVDAETGEYLWSHQHENRWSVQANTVIYHDNRVVFFSGYGKGGGQLLLDDGGKLLRQTWFQEQFDSKMGGAVLIDGFLYGSGDKYRGWMAVDWNTGEQKFYTTDLGKGVVIAADGLMYCYTEKGELALVKPNTEKLEIISQTTVEYGTEQHWAHPVIQNGILYVRHGNAIVAYKVK